MFSTLGGAVATTIYSRFQELSKPQASPIWTDFIHQSLVAQKELMAGVKKHSNTVLGDYIISVSKSYDLFLFNCFSENLCFDV